MQATDTQDHQVNFTDFGQVILVILQLYTRIICHIDHFDDFERVRIASHLAWVKSNDMCMAQERSRNLRSNHQEVLETSQSSLEDTCAGVSF